jgi:hypothetical protein
MLQTGPLLFLLAPVEGLQADRLPSCDLESVQRQGVSSAFALRIVVTRDLGGQLNRVCDAITPRFEPERLWLGVYQPCPVQPDCWQQLDRFPLSEASNDTCWFYPTHNGNYLSWQRDLHVTLGAGQISDPSDERHESYQRDHIALLWSLLADDTKLTCVGITYGGRRIDWPLQQSRWGQSARWNEFTVDSKREQPLVIHSSQVVKTRGESAGAPMAGPG